MKLFLAQINEEGVSVGHLIEEEWLRDVLTTGKYSQFHVQTATHIDVLAQRLGKDVLLRCAFSLPLQVECALCLESFTISIPVDFSLTFKPRSWTAREPPPEQELSREELEEGLVYEGEVIELDELLREQILLALPMYPKCSDQCRGLCPQCGTNLNQESCVCEREEVDPRLIQLKILTKH